LASSVNSAELAKLAKLAFMMEIISKKDINSAVAILKRGGVVVYPTDTAYALGGIFNSRKVTARILKIKQRKDDKFTLIAADIVQVKKFFKLNILQEKLAKKYWPGPFSLVISKRFAVRVPANAVARRLAKGAGRPLIATSANISGGQTLYNDQAVIKEFKNKKNQPELILAAGKLANKKTSTIVKVYQNKIIVFRAGTVKL